MRQHYSENNIFHIDDEITLNLKEWSRFILHRFYVIILAVAAGILLALLITRMFITPVYTSSTKIYVMAKQTEETTVTLSDLELSSQLAADYIQLTSSRPVFESIAKKLDFDINTETLVQSISIETAANARILTISAKNEDPEQAQAIANMFRKEANKRFTKIAGIDSIVTVETASLPESPSSPNLILNLAAGAMIAVLFACIILTYFYSRDDSLKTADDIEYSLDLNVLATIPIRPKGYGANRSSSKDTYHAFGKSSHR